MPFETLHRLAGDEHLNMTLLALNLSRYINGVAKKHGEVSKNMFPGYKIHAITNGVHSFTWTCDSFKRLYDKYLLGWANEPEIFVRVGRIPDNELWEAHMEAKRKLIDYVNAQTQAGMDYDTFTIGFARRAAAYKRADLLFSDMERLTQIGKKRLQIIYAGKAHPKDEPGKQLIQRIFEVKEKLKGKIKVTYIENYNNGVPNFSVLDGWWIEGHIEGFTGWAIGHPSDDPADHAKDADDLYYKLEKVIMPTFYKDRDNWIRVMQNAIGKNAYYFNSHRMMRRYVTEAYIK